MKNRIQTFFTKRYWVSMSYSLLACGLLLPVQAAAITASSSTDDGNVAANTLDNNFSTRWSGQGAGAWIKYDLGSSQTVDDIEIAFYKGDERTSTFDIQVSSNNSGWSTVFSGGQSALNTDLQKFNITDVTARWVRVVGYGNTSNNWNSYTEIKVNTLGGSGGGNNGGGGSANVVPGLIQAEDYVGFFDSTQGNTGGQYRTDDVDIQVTSDANGGHNVGWVAAGEWLEYPISVSSSGNYTAEIRVASKPGGGVYHLLIDGLQKDSSQQVGATGSWQSWTSQSLNLGNLSAGAKTLRLQVTSGNFNINWINISQQSSGGGGDTGTLDPNKAPSDNFDLAAWNISIPIDSDGNGKADTVKENDLNAAYENSQYFYTGSDGGMVFKCFIDGFKTSTNTSYTRTEFREMLRKGNTSIGTKGVNKNNWVFGDAPSSDRSAAGGVDGNMKATLAVNHVTTSGSSSQRGRVIIGQIHANDDEPVRLYYRKLPGNTKGAIYFAHEPRSGSEVYVEMIGSRSSSASNPSDGIELDEQFSYEIDVTGSTLTVTISRPGKATLVESLDMSNSGYTSGGQYMYFKAGVYNQNNTGNGTDYVEATFYDLVVTHN